MTEVDTVADTAPEAGSDWHRLDPKSVVAGLALIVLPAIPSLLIMAISGSSGTTLLTTGGIWFAIGVLVGVFALVSWHYTRYRVTDHRFEMRTGRLSRSHKSIPRDRIRSVDLTAPPLHRVFGLSVVKIGTGQQSGEGEIKLDAISTVHAEGLRRELLRAPSTPGVPAADTVEATAEDELARIRPAWFGYGALTVSLAAVVWGAIGSAVGSFSEVLQGLGFYDTVVTEALALPIWLSVTAGVVGVLTVGALGAVLLSLEMWWGFRLTREQDSTVRVRRGLLTARSLSLEERRLRGVELVEPLLLRWAGGSRLNAVATGLANQRKDDKQPDRAALLPPAPRAETRRVAGLVLRTAQSPVPSSTLRTHPRAALHRRLFRSTVTALVVGAVPVVAASLTGWFVPLAWVLAAALLAIAVASGFEAYRSLGHELRPQYLIARSGAAVRKTVALERSGIIGWRFRQTLFQRRVGLVTLSATTAAGNGAYAVKDVAMPDGLALAEEAVPELLTPFLERDH